MFQSSIIKRQNLDERTSWGHGHVCLCLIQSTSVYVRHSTLECDDGPGHYEVPVPKILAYGPGLIAASVSAHAPLWSEFDC